MCKQDRKKMELSMASPFYHHMYAIFKNEKYIFWKFTTLKFHCSRLTTLRMTQTRTCLASNYFINKPLCMGKKTILSINM